MKMTMTMTPRDKKLLCVVSMVLMLVLWVQFLLRPLLEERTQLSSQQEMTQNRQAEMQTQIAQIPALDAANKANQALLLKSSGSFYGMMSNDALDELVTGLELTHNLTPLTLDIEAAKPQELEPYVASELGQAKAAAAQAAKEAPPVTTTTDAQSTEQPPPQSEPVVMTKGFVQVATISGTAQGSREDFITLLNTLAAGYPAIRVAGFAFSDVTVFDAALTQVQSTQVEFTLEVYMCEKGK